VFVYVCCFRVFSSFVSAFEYVVILSMGEKRMYHIPIVFSVDLEYYLGKLLNKEMHSKWSLYIHPCIYN